MAAAISLLAAAPAMAYTFSASAQSSVFYGTQQTLRLGPTDQQASFDDVAIGLDSSGQPAARSQLRASGPEAHARLQITSPLSVGSLSTSFTDSLQVVAPAGQEVLLRFSLPTDGSIVSLHSIVDVNAGLSLCGGYCQILSYTRHSNDNSTLGSDTAPVSLAFHNGDVLQLRYDFSISAQTNGFGQAYEVDANYLQGSFARIDVLTPGATLTGGSGLFQVSPVPEPGAGALVAAGLAVVIGIARRRRRDLWA